MALEYHGSSPLAPEYSSAHEFGGRLPWELAGIFALKIGGRTPFVLDNSSALELGDNSAWAPAGTAP